MVHLVPGNWNDPYPNSTRNGAAAAAAAPPTSLNVWAYSNADIVELFQNNKSLGTRQVPPNSHVAWNGVEWAPGLIEARAMMSDKPDEAVAVDSVKTSGKTAGLKMTLTWPTNEPLRLHGKGTAMVQLQIVDADGIFVPDANVRVDFKVRSGPAGIVGVGNGDPSSHESDKASFRTTFNGLARCIVQTTTKLLNREAGVAIVLEATMTAAGQIVSSTLAIPVEQD